MGELGEAVADSAAPERPGKVERSGSADGGASTSSGGPRVGLHGVWKRFRRGERHDTLREFLPALARRLLGRERARPPDRHFWALRDVGFEVGPGETLGIIGPNGAGKSTILKLVSGILAPDRGVVEVRGRVGALIELFAGFHHELTGRENVDLQGAVMGMSRAEIREKFDRIVEFAELGDFIDTPIKRYSSGMRARLGFAVAAHLDPDILLVDEVLSVGDAEFQRKATRRMREIAGGGIPVLLVSHDLARVVELCDRALLLTRGEVVRVGPPDECVADYVGKEGETAAAPDCPIALDDISFPTPPVVAPGHRVRLTIRGSVTDATRAGEATLGVRVRSLPEERFLFSTNCFEQGVGFPRGPFALDVELRMNVQPGTYRVQAVAWKMEEDAEWARGPSALVEVRDRRGTYGTVFLDPSLKLRER